MNKTKKTLYGGVIVVIAVVAVLLLSGKHGTKQNTQPTPPPAQSTTTSQSTHAAGNFWTGTLKTSDTPAKGNLMLVTPAQNIYINTGRDFSPLLNKEVAVTYDGDVKSFKLIDIKQK